MYYVLACCDGTEPLLACGVPNLEFDSLAIQLYGANLEVDTGRERVRRMREKRKKDRRRASKKKIKEGIMRRSTALAR